RRGQRPGTAGEVAPDPGPGGRRDPGRTPDRRRPVRGGDRGPGLRQPGGGRGHRGDGGRGGDPDPEEPQGAAGERPGAVQGPQPGGAVLVEGQAVPAGGHPVRQDRPELPGVRSGGLDHGAAALTCTTAITYLLSTRPRQSV